MSSSKRNKFLDDLQKDLEAFDTIAIFPHQYPDPDAFGSARGVKLWLEEKYPDKKVIALCSAINPDYQAETFDPKTTLGIIVDTSNSPRVEDPRWKELEKTYRIDHHVPIEEFASEEWLDDSYTATCEMVADMLSQAGESISEEAAQALYEGLIADNLRFSTDKVSPRTFQAAAWLAKQGIDTVKAAEAAFGNTYDSFVWESKVREKAHRKEDFLFSVMSAQDYLSLGYSFAFAKEKVYALGDIKDIQVWALFTQMEDGVHYSASLRSRTIPIRDLAVRFHGGGHDCASGIKNLTIADVSVLIEELAARSKMLDFTLED